MNNVITLNGRRIEYELERKNVKNINLRIRSDCTVYVSAKPQIAIDVIEAFLRKKASFVISALDKYEDITKYTDTNHNYVTGEGFSHLGKNLRLIVTSGKNEVTTDGIYLTLCASNVKDIALKHKLIAKWYDIECRRVFNEIITTIYPLFQKYGVAMPKLTIRDMTSRWGSCQPKRNIITLNKRLIAMPRNSIEYVVVHEFTHFLHPNHSKKFYALLSAFMPDWKERKKILESSNYLYI
jgi:predicted metal-dependent hydrolase